MERRGEGSQAVLPLFLLFGEAVLQADNAVKGCGILAVLAEVAHTNELELFTGSGIVQAGLNHSVFELGTSAPANFGAMREVINYVSDVGAHFLPQCQGRRCGIRY